MNFKSYNIRNFVFKFRKTLNKKWYLRFKKKAENNIKDVISINNSTFKRCNEYSDKRNIILEDKMKNSIKLINEKQMDLRI